MNPSGFVTLTAGATLSAGTRVKNSAGKLVAAGLTDGRGVELGTLEQNVVDGQPAAVRGRSYPGSRRMIASGAIGQYVEVFTDANGKVSATRGTNAKSEGISLTAAGADNDYVEVLTDPE